jgi:nuclear pore complex protein Nup205
VDGALLTSDGQRIDYEYARIFSETQRRGWIFKLIALELHALSLSKQEASIKRLLEVLLKGQEQFTNLSQAIGTKPKIKLLELFEANDFEWSQSAQYEPMDSSIRFFTQFDFEHEGFFIMNDRQCVIYNVPVIYERLQAAQRELEQRGMINGNAQRQQARNEIRNVLLQHVFENNRRELLHAKFHCLEGWRSCCIVGISECYQYLPAENRNGLFYYTCDTVLSKLSKIDNSAPVSELLSEVVLAASSQMRHEIGGKALPDAFGFSWPPERLASLFKALINVIPPITASVAARGNIYAAILNYIRFANSSAIRLRAPQRSGSKKSDILDTMSVVSDTSHTSDFGASVKRGTLESANLSILNAAGERFLEQICRDALEAPDAWRTVAFAVLASLASVWKRERDDRLLQYLTRWNVLRQFVATLRRDDQVVEATLKPGAGKRFSSRDDV